MKFNELLKIIGHEPVFKTGLLLAGNADPKDVRKQLSRWVAAEKLIQIRRGLYIPAPPNQKVRPHPFVIANALVTGSYVSCESALAWHGLIPEYVPVIVSVSMSRPGLWTTPVGSFQFHHIRPALHFGYGPLLCEPGQEALVAAPEKALLDLVHLTKGGDRMDYLKSLRLQNLDTLDKEKLTTFADRSQSPKLIRAAQNVTQLILEENEAYQPL